jgi:hypothetical protein
MPLLSQRTGQNAAGFEGSFEHDPYGLKASVMDRHVDLGMQAAPRFAQL